MTSTPTGTEGIIDSTTTSSNSLENAEVAVPPHQLDSEKDAGITSNYSISSPAPIQNEMTIKHPRYEAAHASVKCYQQLKRENAIKLQRAKESLAQYSVEQQKHDVYEHALLEDRESDLKLLHAQKEFQALDQKHPQDEVAKAAFESTQKVKKQTVLRLEVAKLALDESSVAYHQARDIYHQALNEDRESDLKLSLAQEKFQALDLQVPGQWNSMYYKLVAYKEKYGHCKVSQDRCFGKEKKTNQKRRKSDDFNDADPDLQSLARWVGNQRVFYKYFQNGDTKHIKAHRIDALKKLGFVWDIKEHRWMEWYYQLKEYKNINGHCRVRIKDNKELHHWASRQQREYSKMKQGAPYSLGIERIKLLEEIDFDFEPLKFSKRKVPISPEELWEQKYMVLKAFYDEHGHSQVNVRSLASSHNLTDWVAYLRNQYLYFQDGKQSILNPERIALLEALNFQWKKALSLPRKNCGTKKRRGEENDKIRRVSSTSDNCNADTTIVVDSGKEAKEESNLPSKIRRISALIEADGGNDVKCGVKYSVLPTMTNNVNYGIGNVDTLMVTGDDTCENKIEDTPTMVKGVSNYGCTAEDNSIMVTDNSIMVTDNAKYDIKLEDISTVQDPAEGTEEVSNSLLQTGQLVNSLNNNVAIDDDKCGVKYVGTSTVADDTSKTISEINTPMITGCENKTEDSLIMVRDVDNSIMVSDDAKDDNKTEDTPLLQDVAEDTKGVSNSLLHTGQTSSSLINNLAVQVNADDTVNIVNSGANTTLVSEFLVDVENAADI